MNEQVRAMTLTHDQPGSTEPGSGKQYPCWAGQQDPGGPAGPGDRGEETGGGPQQPWWRRRALAAAAGLSAAVLAAAGLNWALAPPAASPLTIAQITARTDPALVDVVSTLGYEHATSAGTGLVLTPSGEVLTNNHVIEGATAIRVTDVGNGHTYRAVVAGYDRTDDLAVLQLQHASGLKTVVLGDSSTVRAGDAVVGIGNAAGRGGRPTAAAGTVTALGQAITASDEASGTSEHLTGLIGTSAKIVAGDSGGPLVNSQGQVIGIDTAGSAQYRLPPEEGQTRGYAIPINKALRVASQIVAGKPSATVHIGATAFLGVMLPPANAQAGLPGGSSAGATIVGVAAGSPAAKAGLTGGDEIVSLGGHRVFSATGIQQVLTGYHPGDKISIGWLDQTGRAHIATVLLATGPAA